jgi:ABC-2 type transport system permease protein
MNLRLPSVGFLLPIFVLCWREVVRFLRQRSRIAGALGSPLVFWVLLGSGFGSSFRDSPVGGKGYLEYFFPGTLLMILLFASIFSSISVIEERHGGFLLSVLVAPVPRLSLVLGLVGGGTLLAFLQSAFFLVLAPAAGISVDGRQLATTLLVLLVIALSLTSLGLAVAWHMDSIPGFHALMNLLLVPMWVLSGAVFPLSSASVWLRGLMIINPLTYCQTALRKAIYLPQESPAAGPVSFPLSLLATVFFGLVMLMLACWIVNRQDREEMF